MKEEYRQAIANKLRMIRLERRYRIEDLAQKSGVAASTISRYESGNVDMSIQKIFESMI